MSANVVQRGSSDHQLDRGKQSLSQRPSRPYTIINMAMTADGKIATANRAITSFGSSADHNHLLELRATADAVLCGAATAGGENITMGPGPLRFRRKRLQRGLAEFNLRVIASGSGSLDPKSSIFNHRFSPIIVLTTKNVPPARWTGLRAVANEVAQFGKEELDLASAMQWLRRQWNIKRLICEGGGQLNDAMFRAGLVDELHLTLCPFLFGGRMAPTVAEGSGFARLSDAAQLKLRSRRAAKEEMFLVYEVVCSGASPF